MGWPRCRPEWAVLVKSCWMRRISSFRRRCTNSGLCGGCQPVGVAGGGALEIERVEAVDRCAQAGAGTTDPGRAVGGRTAAQCAGRFPGTEWPQEACRGQAGPAGRGCDDHGRHRRSLRADPATGRGDMRRCDHLGACCRSSQRAHIVFGTLPDSLRPKFGTCSAPPCILHMQVKPT